MEYKDIMLPGTTTVNMISLEDDYILFHRDPDYYRFRIAALPTDLTLPPHSEYSNILFVDESIPGDPTRAFDQPKGAESHIGLLCRLYSPNPDTFRVFMLDIHKTPTEHYVNTTITDGSLLKKEEDDHQTKTKNWIRRDRHSTFRPRLLENTIEYVGIMEGAHLYPERIEIDIPEPFISRSATGKTMVVSIINRFYTFDFTNRTTSATQKRQHAYKQKNGEILPEFYHLLDDEVSESSNIYDDTDILGIKLNEDATLLAVWTEMNIVYIYKRGASDRIHGHTGDKLPHYLEDPMPWKLRMAINPIDGKLGTVPVGSIIFWKSALGRNYISVSMKSNAVNTYLIDEFGEIKEWSFMGFAKERYGLIIVMSAVIALFVANENETYRR
ncbi:hypothetical protein G6F57_008849 [Rhizopus arrhizus]|uniref:Uncharacterized protein n=1 Tax=Rhizopus oryzae TaxID=64495 RepID=A0A9P6X480_RHIOR|nr:hypothetical protein G6F23_005133 [Rhizopus arrhizus]KAG1405660.1 hypothetical protein G6F58_009976 [Rhizopus delemar]KAG0759891.1 hypothetical protein G6F24_008734 [Rhizopus arrhizus]KAG0786103.1 hypothetical protein G6F21_008826 [Rhizopus arrhizus]KAG0808710.1 hypothetical protein G6F20_009356 [Rhizopus arrhizus]